MYSLSAIDLLPPDVDDEDAELEASQVRYTELARLVDTEDLMAMVGDALSTSDVLRGLIEDVKASPFGPDERKRLHVSDCLKLGEVMAQLIDQALDSLVSMMEVGHAAD
jgi:hypothetical protein